MDFSPAATAPDTTPHPIAAQPAAPSLAAELAGTLLLLGLAFLVTVGVALTAQAVLHLLD